MTSEYSALTLKTLMLNAVQLDTACMLTTVIIYVNVCCTLYTLLPSHKWIIQIMQLAALHEPVDLDFLHPTNHIVYVINAHRLALKQLSQDYTYTMVKLWL